MIAAFLEIGFSLLWQVFAPNYFECRARCLETRRRAMAMLAGMASPTEGLCGRVF